MALGSSVAASRCGKLVSVTQQAVCCLFCDLERVWGKLVLETLGEGSDLPGWVWGREGAYLSC